VYGSVSGGTATGQITIKEQNQIVSDSITTWMSCLQKAEEEDYDHRNLHLDKLSFTGEAIERNCDVQGHSRIQKSSGLPEK
jgi:hypothetical protein